jgi:hypothetical protein
LLLQQIFEFRPDRITFCGSSGYLEPVLDSCGGI